MPSRAQNKSRGHVGICYVAKGKSGLPPADLQVGRVPGITQGDPNREGPSV